MQAVVTALSDEALTPEALRTEDRAMMTPALKFWKSIAPALEAKPTNGRTQQGLTGRRPRGVVR
jgi:hypothetical protein